MLKVIEAPLAQFPPLNPESQEIIESFSSLQRNKETLDQIAHLFPLYSKSPEIEKFFPDPAPRHNNTNVKIELSPSAAALEGTQDKKLL